MKLITGTIFSILFCFGAFDSGQRTSNANDVFSQENIHSIDYAHLDGTWVNIMDSSATMKIKGLLRSDYYRKNFLGSVKIKLDSSSMFVYSPKQEDKLLYKLQILSLSSQKLALRNTKSKLTIHYVKKKD